MEIDILQMQKSKYEYIVITQSVARVKNSMKTHRGEIKWNLI